MTLPKSCTPRQVVAVEAYAVPGSEGVRGRGGGAAALQQQWSSEKATEEARRQSAGSAVNKSDGGGGGEDFNPAFPGFSPSPTPRKMAP